MMELLLQLCRDYARAKSDCGLTTSNPMLVALPGLTGINQGKSHKQTHKNEHSKKTSVSRVSKPHHSHKSSRSHHNFIIGEDKNCLCARIRRNTSSYWHDCFISSVFVWIVVCFMESVSRAGVSSCCVWSSSFRCAPQLS